MFGIATSHEAQESIDVSMKADKENLGNSAARGECEDANPEVDVARSAEHHTERDRRPVLYEVAASMDAGERERVGSIGAS